MILAYRLASQKRANPRGEVTEKMMEKASMERAKEAEKKQGKEAGKKKGKENQKGQRERAKETGKEERKENGENLLFTTQMGNQCCLPLFLRLPNSLGK